MVYILTLIIMAITTNGFYNNPNGKIGKMVYYMLRGQLVSRSIGRPGNPTVPQLANRQAMSVTMDVLSDMVDFINEGFLLEAHGTTKNQYNLATSYNKKNALKGVYPNLSIDYSKLKLSSGKLDAPVETTLVKTKCGVEISWDSQHHPTGKAEDMAMVVLYHPVLKSATTVLYATQRSKGTCFISLQGRWLDGPVEAYMFFKSANGKAVSDSVYLGNLNGTVKSVEMVVVEDKDKKGKTRFKAIEVTDLPEFNRIAKVKRKEQIMRNPKVSYSDWKDFTEEPPEE